jgi:nucleoside-diphosphate-sugar epimerase
MDAEYFTVLGASGTIGQALTQHLRASDHVVQPIGRNELAGLLADREPCGHVINCIGLTGDFRSRPLATADAHVTVTARCLASLRFRSFLYLSSTRVYARAGDTGEAAELPSLPSDPSDLYNLTKLAGEALCLTDDRPTVRVARLSNVFSAPPSPDTFLGQVMSEGMATGRVRFRQAAGSAKDYISLDTVVRLLPAIARWGRRRLYNVASGANMTHGTIADILSHHRGWDVRFMPGAPRMTFAPIDVSQLTAEFPALAANHAASLADVLIGRPATFMPYSSEAPQTRVP